MSTMPENAITARAENRPPMLERSQYDSWQSRMLLYIRGKEHGMQLLDSVKNDPFQFGTVEVPVTPNTSASIRESYATLHTSRMLLYIRGKEHGMQLIDSVKNGPFQFETVEVLVTPNTSASTRERTLTDLTPEEQIREACIPTTHTLHIPL
ncbi:hypothetical protein Tco_0921609 [Tanacetum coccineum]